MFHNQILFSAELAWPAAIAVAWLVGEAGKRWLGLPRISSYGFAGFCLAASQGGFLPSPDGGVIALLADFAFALILFELGYRINLRWLVSNPWLGVTSVLESGATFAAVFFVAKAFGLEMVPALILGALAMSTSPAAVLRVANESGSSGQVTERLIHLTAFNCVFAAIAFKGILGYWVISTEGTFFMAMWTSVVVICVSAGIGALSGVVVPWLLRLLGGADSNPTVAFAIGALVLTALTHAFKFSPLMAALAFGLVARHRRAILSPAQRNFGTLGDLLTVVLFVFVAASLHWHQVVAGLGIAGGVVAARFAAKTVVTTVLARLGGMTMRKGALMGLAMTPMSVFVIQLLEQTRRLEMATLENVFGIAAIVLLLEIVGPLATQRALVWAGETHHREVR